MLRASIGCSTIEALVTSTGVVTVEGARELEVRKGFVYMRGVHSHTATARELLVSPLWDLEVGSLLANFYPSIRET